ncbi:ASK10 [[Candida] subhashii]|uniref:ASK10 n=1 Tax=[Candida] subhashii TaxID=561895 RepID=A0A8J5QQE4_9ASCO|nr:ASK10 [[Candida] subhashii]KAG7664553.1 ASK10 [[Candida] subhashii]
MTSHYQFIKETVLPPNDPKSPFYHNLPSFETKPIDELVDFFKYWKSFIKSLIYYLKEIAIVKEYESNLHFQLISSVSFPGCKDLPNKIIQDILTTPSASNTTPTKELRKNLSNTSLNNEDSSDSSSSIAISPPVGAGADKRPQLSKSKSATSAIFLKNMAQTHKRASSSVSLKSGLSPPPAVAMATSASSINLVNTTEINTNDIQLPTNFFPPNSMYTNLPALLLSHHQDSFLKNHKLYRDLNNKLIPRLETLLKQLSSKIKEIKHSLTNESFANTDLSKEISNTGQILTKYCNSVELYNAKNPVMKGKLIEDEANVDDEEAINVMGLDDPLLIKLRVDYQIKNQLLIENYMFASYMNLQTISRDLFTYVIKELNWVVDKFGKLQLNSEYYQFLKDKISNSSTNDWEYFIMNDPNFINNIRPNDVNPKREIRNFKTITLPYANSIQNKCIRFGLIYKKSRLLKNYTRHYYVLSCNYLHEFKCDDDDVLSATTKKSQEKIGGFIGPDMTPINSYNLNEYFIISKQDASSSHKFTLVKTDNPLKKIKFKCLTQSEFDQWYADLTELLKFGNNHHARFAFLQKQHQQRLQPQKSPAPTVAGSRDSLTVNHNEESKLLGMFTPRIQTPIGEHHDMNPFEHSFGTSDLTSSPETGNVSSGHSSPEATSQENKDNSNNSLISQQHQHYLKLQQALLKQQHVSFRNDSIDRAISGSEQREEGRNEEVLDTPFVSPGRVGNDMRGKDNPMFNLGNDSGYMSSSTPPPDASPAAVATADSPAAQSQVPVVFVSSDH